LQNILDPFEVKSGLKQGDALSPALLNLAFKKIIRDTNDIVVMAKTKEEVTNTTSKLIKASK